MIFEDFVDFVDKVNNNYVLGKYGFSLSFITIRSKYKIKLCLSFTCKSSCCQDHYSLPFAGNKWCNTSVFCTFLRSCIDITICLQKNECIIIIIIITLSLDLILL